MVLRILIFAFLAVLAPAQGMANDRLVKLYAPAALVETGLLKYALPRFSLKTQVRVEIVEDMGSADVGIGPTGKPLFEGIGQRWHLDVQRTDHKGTKRFVDWLNSDVGKRTVLGFAPNGTALFSVPSEAPVETVAVGFDGDAGAGHDVARRTCRRCHAVDVASRGSGIGSTPSFAILRSLQDWEERFSAFFVLPPHPSFTQIEDITEPFPINRPSPIVPIELTLDDLEALLAYVSELEQADLGAPLVHQ